MSSELFTERNGAVLFSNDSDEWETPAELFNALNLEFGFTLDPCATDSNFKTRRYFTRAENGLLKSWANQTVYVNPPYSEIDRWMAKALGASIYESAIVAVLVPSRTDTDWWHRYAMRGEIRFLKGRLQFNRSANNAPFPSAIIVFRPQSFALKGMEF